MIGEEKKNDVEMEDDEKTENKGKIVNLIKEILVHYLIL